MKYKNYISTIQKKRNADYALKDQSLKKTKVQHTSLLGYLQFLYLCIYRLFFFPGLLLNLSS